MMETPKRLYELYYIILYYELKESLISELGHLKKCSYDLL